MSFHAAMCTLEVWVSTPSRSKRQAAMPSGSPRDATSATVSRRRGRSVTPGDLVGAGVGAGDHVGRSLDVRVGERGAQELDLARARMGVLTGDGEDGAV